MATFEDALQAMGANDFIAARAACARAAKAGDPRAMLQLGRWHAAGECGCTRDPGLAAYWYFQAWQAGLDDAEGDIIRVRAALEEAVMAGSASAQNALGLLLLFGHDDPAAAAVPFELAAAQDHPEALRMLGTLFAEGRGVEKDELRAAELYLRAAERGDPFAQFNLAAMTPDRETAIHWYRAAAAAGMPEAQERLDELLTQAANG